MARPPISKFDRMLANMLKQSREKDNFSQTELAALIGTSKQMINYFEHKKSRMTPEILFRLAARFKWDLNKLRDSNWRGGH